MTLVTCRLAAKNRDQLRNPTLSNRVWATFTYTFTLPRLNCCCWCVAGDGDVCGGVDQCWSHDSSAVNASLCYFPCTASTTTSSPADITLPRLCTAHRDRAPSVEPRRRPARRRPPWAREDRRGDGATPLVAAAASEAPRCPRCLPLLCLVGVAAAMVVAAAAAQDCHQLPPIDGRDFRTGDGGKFQQLPVVNNIVFGRRGAATPSCNPRLLWTSKSLRCRGAKLATRTTRSSFASTP